MCLYDLQGQDYDGEHTASPTLNWNCHKFFVPICSLYVLMVSVCMGAICGIHPSYSGMVVLPYFDKIDPISINVLLVTQ